jgi:hypothetical protein
VAKAADCKSVIVGSTPTGAFDVKRHQLTAEALVSLLEIEGFCFSWGHAFGGHDER